MRLLVRVLKGGEVGLDRKSALGDGLFEARFGEGQHARTANGAEQDRADHTVIPVGRLLHVKENRTLSVTARQLQQLLVVGGALT